MTLTVGSLFSGIGGIDLAFERAGCRILWQSEIDRDACRVLANHFPGVPNLGDITEIDGATTPHPDIITGGFPCFPAGTLILTDAGLKDIVEVQVGDQVLTHRGRYMPVTRVMNRRSRIVQLSGKGHPALRTTPNHPFWSVSKHEHSTRVQGHSVRIKEWSEATWIPAKDMQGRYWATPHTFPSLPVPKLSRCRTGEMRKMTPALWRLVGRWLGDGWLVTHQRNNRPSGQRVGKVVLCGSWAEEQQLAALVAEAGFHATPSGDPTTCRFIISDIGFARWLEAHFGRLAAGKRLPAWSLGMGQDAREELLRGYLDADGSHADNADKAATVSKELAIGMRLLACSLGYSTCLYENEVAAQKAIGGRTVSQRNWWQITLRRGVRGQRSDELCDFGLVRSVDPTDMEEKVYDLTVDTDHSFLADGIVVHNCQDVSVAGRRAGLAGERSGLWFEFHRLLAALAPTWVLIENVPGLCSSNCGRDLATIVGGLEEFGYRWAYRTLDAQYHGLAQRRRRVFLVGHLGGSGAVEVLFEPESVCRDSAPRREAGTRPARNSEIRPGTGSEREEPTGDSGAGKQSRPGGRSTGWDVCGTASTLQGGGRRGQRLDAESAAGGHVIPILESGARQGTGADQRDGTGIGGAGDPMFTLQAGKQHGVFATTGQSARRSDQITLSASDDNGSNAVCVTGERTHALTSEGMDASEDGTGRGAPIIPFDTTQVTSDKNYSHPREGDTDHPLAGGAHPPAIAGYGVRRLTPTECERLMGLPDHWTAGLSDSARYRCLGNSVALPCVEWIARRLVRVVALQSREDATA